MADLDKIAFSNLTNTYQNYRTMYASIAISGTVGAGSNTGNDFAPIFTYDRDKTRADLYYQRASTLVKAPANASTRLTSDIYTFAGAEICYSFIDYLPNNEVQFGVYIQNNTGSPINLTTQTINLILVLYDAPFAT